MIAHFALMGELYQYDPYETEASLWNSYPWQIGRDNGLGINSSLPEFSMSKMIWVFDELDSSIGSSSAELGDFSMFATLITMDNFGNLGSDVGNTPSPFPYTLIGVTDASVLSVQSIASLIVANSNADSPTEAPLIGVTDAAVLSASSKLTLIVANSNADSPTEAPLIGVTDAAVLSVSSTLQV